MNSIRRAYVSIESECFQGQIHYRSTSDIHDVDEAVILLHPSPLSSEFLLPMMSLFSAQAEVIAWDAPGYGQSDSLAVDTEGLQPYVETLNKFIINLGLDRVIIYGSATGAQIAIEYGKAYPEKVKGLILDNAAWFYDEEREAMMADYFPSLEPKSDGSHITLAWKISENLYRYFPWYDETEAAKINDQPTPLALIAQTAACYLAAWDDYSRAYRAAFANENPKQLQALKVPSKLIRWEGSMLKKYTDRLDNAELPNTIKMCYAEASPQARSSVLENTLQELLALE